MMTGRVALANPPTLQFKLNENMHTSYPIHTPHVVRIGCQPLATHTRMTRYKPYQLTCPSALDHVEKQGKTGLRNQ